MSIIKGMEMPKNCGGCKFFAWKRGVGQHCAVDDRITFHATIDGMDVAYERNGKCPLAPVPSHGDLIDRYDLKHKKITINYDEWDDTFDDGLLFVADLIDNAPTIIPAEEGECE